MVLPYWSSHAQIDSRWPEIIADDDATLLEAARGVGINIPTICWHDSGAPEAPGGVRHDLLLPETESEWPRTLPGGGFFLLEGHGSPAMRARRARLSGARNEQHRRIDGPGDPGNGADRRSRGIGGLASAVPRPQRRPDRGPSRSVQPDSRREEDGRRQGKPGKGGSGGEVRRSPVHSDGEGRRGKGKGGPISMSAYRDSLSRPARGTL